MNVSYEYVIVMKSPVKPKQPSTKRYVVFACGGTKLKKPRDRTSVGPN
jgi:hypothetical protein